jgi:hypothetical protein
VAVIAIRSAYRKIASMGKEILVSTPVAIIVLEKCYCKDSTARTVVKVYINASPSYCELLRC